MTSTINIQYRKSTKVKNEDFSFYISFDYRKDIVENIKTLPLRFYNPTSKEWEIPVSSLGTVIGMFGKEHIIYEGPAIVQDEFVEEEEEDVDDIQFVTKPYQHQVEGVKFGLKHKKFMLADQQGLGKTKQVIDIATAKKDKTSKTLIITGVASLKWNWLKEIKIHSDECGHVLGMRKNTKDKLVDKGNKARIEDLENIDNLNCYFLITNIESLRNKEIQKHLKKLTSDGTLNIVAIDEIHRGGGKNGQSQAGKAIHQLQSEYKIALTGTPLVNKPLDLYNIMKWLGYEKRSFYAFRNTYCEMGGFKGYEVVGYKNMEDLKNKVEKVQLRRLKEDVLDLPEKIRSTDFVELTGKQKQTYKSVQRELRDQLDEILELDNPLAKMLRLRQVTSYPKLIKEDVKENVKLDRLRQLIGENVKNGEKTIVYSNWTQITEMLAEELSECNPAYIVGGSDTQEEIKKFQEDDSCKIIIGTIGAMGTGITLTKASNIIFYDRPWNFSTVEQAEDRAHRIGTTKNVNIVSLVVKDSIDEVVEEIINTKKDLSDLLVDGKLEHLSKYDLIERILE